MTKNWHTKKKILKFIGKNTKTPGEISSKLGLAPSTVSEHLEGLEKIGAVKKVDNPHVKKWKYYSLNPAFNIDSMTRKSSNAPIAAAATVAVILILSLFALMTFGIPTASAANQVAFRLTDPPKVPNGTQALNITYSSIQAHIAGSGNESGWISGSGSGTIDLMDLINSSQVIGTGKIPANASIDLVRFSIEFARIVVNNVTYNVTVPNGQLTANVTGISVVNSSSSILIDLSPVVAAIYTENSTVFVLVPSLRAVVVGGEKTPFKIGDRMPLNHDDVNTLNNTSSKISITAANLSVIGNDTMLEVTIKNSADENVSLDDVMMLGIPSVFVAPDPIGPMWSNETRGMNINAKPGSGGDRPQGMPGKAYLQYPPGSVGPGLADGGAIPLRGYGRNGIMGGINVTAVGNWGGGVIFPNLTANESQNLGRMVRVGAQARMFQMLNFIVARNGTLVLPSISKNEGPAMPLMCENCFGSSPDLGYVLKPGASVTLRFSGSMLYADEHMQMSPVKGSAYELIVTGQDGVEARLNVTAI